MRTSKILILGKGRMGQVIFHYLKKLKVAKNVAFFSSEREIKKYELLIGVLPGKIGEKSWRLALRYKKDLIDVSDLDPGDYLKFEKEVKKKKIRIVPECGFSPGLTNLICGHEASLNKIQEIEISAGTLSEAKFFFPFTWCFEDLIEGHELNATLIKKGKKIFLPSFSGYQKEKINGITAESYFSAGLSSLPLSLGVKNISYRALRPFGFFHFFQFLKSQGFFRKDNLEATKRILEGQKEDNLTIAKIKILSKNKKIIWQIKSFSKKSEKLNSMQKITGIMPVLIAEALLTGKIKDYDPPKDGSSRFAGSSRVPTTLYSQPTHPKDGGLLFMEKIGKDKKLFKEILEKLKKEKILIKRQCYAPPGSHPGGSAGWLPGVYYWQ